MGRPKSKYVLKATARAKIEFLRYKQRLKEGKPNEASG